MSTSFCAFEILIEFFRFEKQSYSFRRRKTCGFKIIPELSLCEISFQFSEPAREHNRSVSSKFVWMCFMTRQVSSVSEVVPRNWIIFSKLFLWDSWKGFTRYLVTLEEPLRLKPGGNTSFVYKSCACDAQLWNVSPLETLVFWIGWEWWEFHACSSRWIGWPWWGLGASDRKKKIILLNFCACIVVICVLYCVWWDTKEQFNYSQKDSVMCIWKGANTFGCVIYTSVYKVRKC